MREQLRFHAALCGEIAERDHLALRIGQPGARVVVAETVVCEPLFCSQQAWRHDIPRWAGSHMPDLRLEATFGLAYNGAVFAREGLGVLLTFARLVDTGADSGLVFRPLTPTLETKLHLVWRRNRPLSPIAERFLTQIRSAR